MTSVKSDKAGSASPLTPSTGGTPAKPTRGELIQMAIMLGLIWAATAFIVLALDNAKPVLVLSVACSAGAVAITFFPIQARQVGNLCFRYRWLLALALFALGVLLRLSGSSIGMYNQVLPTQITPEQTTLFGEPRSIRSDEFRVSVPTFFSQAFNEFHLYSQQMGISPTNMVLDYYSPVWDITAIGKPMAWGFLLFGNEVGLSWYWCGLELLIFMTAGEMLLILTKGHRLPSFLGAALILLAPEIQWWMLPHMPIVIMYAMALFCIGYAFFTVKAPWAKWLSATGAVVGIVGFSLSIFPSFQVPCAYTIVALLAVCLFRDREKLRMARIDALRIACVIVASAGIIVPFVVSSAQDFSLLLGTVYPGSRSVRGAAWGIDALFTDLSSFYLPYADATYLNNCEASTYIHFAPFFALLAPRLFPALRRRKDPTLAVGICLLCIVLVEGIFMVVGFPQFLADITLFRFCNRMNAVYGWTAALFTVWGIAALLRHPDILTRVEKVLYPLAYGLLSLFTVSTNTWGYFQSISEKTGHPIGYTLAAIALICLVCLLFLVLFRQNPLFAALLLTTMVVAGATVNPIERGIGAIANHPLSAQVAQVSSEEPDARWLATNNAFYLNNFAMANGARVMNATQFYPDVAQWEIVDPEGACSDATNRYANEYADIVEEGNSVEAVYPDYIEMHLTPETLMALEIRYLISEVDYTETLARHDISCKRVGGQDGYGLYRLEPAGAATDEG